ncbi:MAG: hypothetical protein ACE5JQ_01810 [Candidatus Methylomirabilales bacterium]
MPEQISKYPEVTIKVLKGAGARCGEGVKQKILIQCPRERFCALPTGEICVYGIKEIPQMTQITTQELARVVCPPERKSSMTSALLSNSEVALLAATFAVGLVVGRSWRNFKKH